MKEITWKHCMELASTICMAVFNSEDEELLEIKLGQLAKIKKIIEDETKAYFENTNI